MAKFSKEGGKNVDFKRTKFVHPNVEKTITKQVKSGEYELQNLTRPIRKGGVYYQNGIGLLTTDQAQLFDLTTYQPTQIPFLIGGKDQFKAAVGLITTQNLEARNQAYLELIGVYEANKDLLQNLRQEKNILDHQILKQLGLEYSVTRPLANVNQFGESSHIIHKDDNTLEGKIVSTISPFVGYTFQIRDNDTELIGYVSEELKEKGKEFQYTFAA